MAVAPVRYANTILKENAKFSLSLIMRWKYVSQPEHKEMGKEIREERNRELGCLPLTADSPRPSLPQASQRKFPKKKKIKIWRVS